MKVSELEFLFSGCSRLLFVGEFSLECSVGDKWVRGLYECTFGMLLVKYVYSNP